MSNIIKEIEAEQLKATVDQFEVGDTVKVYGKIKEGNRERIQVFEGVVLKRQGGSNRETFTVRKTSNGIGVEKTWPLHSPNVEKIEVVRKGKVRRAKLNYLRDRVGKKAKVKVFEGVVLKRQGGSNRETFTVRKTSNGIGVEKTWPLHSPNVEKIEVVRKGKVRRAKLNYLRDRVGKKAKVKELVK